MLKNLKYRMAEKRLGSIQENSNPVEVTGTGKEILVVLDSWEQVFRDKFYSLKGELGFSDKDFRMIICTKGKEVNLNNIHFVASDVAWNGRIKNSEVQGLLGRSYDVLVAFTRSSGALPSFIIRNTKASLKIGRKENGGDLYDLSISTRFEDLDVFLKETKKYLNIIK